MADHLDAPGLTPPGGDPSIDITDVYAFQKPGEASKSILMLNVNPLTLSSAFQSNAIYDLNVDTNGDALADLAFRIKFSALSAGVQTAAVRLATGNSARKMELTGDVIINNAQVSFGKRPIVTAADGFTFFAGVRSDPFFFDLVGFLNGFAFTGDDFFGDKNVFGIVLEVPNTVFGATGIGVWGRVLVPADRVMQQVERMGRPAINTVFMKGHDKVGFNQSEPSEDFAQYSDNVIGVLTSFGHTAEAAAGLAAILLPDILTFNTVSSAGFLNGRNLTDDVIDIELGIVSNGAVTTDGVPVHTDLLNVFPFMGPPHKM